jgi:hypothetical protein
MQSACWADYDNDGWIDLYINNYYLENDITNWLFHNNGNGTFTEVSAIAGVDNGSKPTYQSNWIDYDRDGDQDLYVGNDRDVGNQLYNNQGNGTFLPDTCDALNPYMKAMGVQWHDHDYDGDFDVFITNDNLPSALIENQEGQFIDATDSLHVGCANNVSWGVQWTDPDNDGLDDLCIVNKDFTNITCHYQRNPDLSYTLNTSSILSQLSYSSYCLVTGDFNNDGREDLVQNTVSPQRILVWLANPSSNNAITIGLEGIVSNHDAIGAIIEVHAGDKHLIKQVTCGESFFGQSSQREIFGLGSLNTIDSVLVYWPSGWIDIVYNPDVNQYLHISEGSSYIDYPETFNIHRCFNENVVLETQATNGVIWDNGDTLSSRIIDSAGVFTCTIPGPFNHEHLIIFQVTDFAPIIHYDTTPILCSNTATGAIAIDTIENVQSISWQTGDTAAVISNLSPGTYAATIDFFNGCSALLSISLDNPEPIQPWIWADTICANTSTAITYSSSGGTGVHTWNWFGADPNALSPGAHAYSITDESGCIFEDQVVIIQQQQPILTWTTPIVCVGDAATVAINANEPIIIDWEEYDQPLQLPAGTHPFAYSTEDGCWYDSLYVVEEFATMAASIEATDSTGLNGNSIFTIDITGGAEPFLYDWNTGDTGIYASNNGGSFMSCLITDANGCIAQAELWINGTASINSSSITVFPNPTCNGIQLNSHINQEWFLIDAGGRVVDHNTTKSRLEHIDLQSLAAGYYLLRLGMEHITVIKQE